MVKIIVDKETCIGCGACVSVAPEILKLDQENKAEPIAKEVMEEEKAKEAAAVCPVQAITLES